jgi:hypothetical protein
MSGFADRLERELLDAGRRSYEGRARQPRAGMLALVTSTAVTAAVVAVVLETGVFGADHGASTQHPGQTSTRPQTAAGHGVCRRHRSATGEVVPPLVYSKGKPGRRLLGELGVLRAPATATDHLDRRTFNRFNNDAAVVYT